MTQTPENFDENLVHSRVRLVSLQRPILQAPTAFVAAAKSGQATLNTRKELLIRLGALNKLGRRDLGLSIGSNGDVWVDGTPLEEVNAELVAAELGELTIIPTSSFWRALGSVYAELTATACDSTRAGAPTFVADWRDARPPTCSWRPPVFPTPRDRNQPARK